MFIDKIMSLNYSKNLGYTIDFDFNKELNNNFNNFYSSSNDIDELLMSIFLELKKNYKNLSKSQLNLLILKLKLIKIDKELFLNKKIIQNEKDFFFGMLSLIIIKSFSIKNTKKKENIFEKDNNDLKKNYSYSIINTILNNIDYLFIYFNFHNENNNTNFNNKIIWEFLVILIDSKIITKINMYISKNKSQSLLYLNTNSLVLNKILHVHFIEPKVITHNNKYYLLTNHFSTVKLIFKPNKYSNSSFYLKNLDLLITYAKTSFIISIENLNFIVNKKLELNNLKKEDVTNNYIKLIDDYRNFIKEGDIKSIKDTSKKISFFDSLINLINILDFLKEDTKIFLPFSWDFRGRNYYQSDISPTFISEIRYCMYDTYKNQKKEEEEELFDINLYNKIKNTLLNYENLIETLNYPNINLNNLNSKKKEYILWILISIAEIDKTKLGKAVHIKQFLKHGINLINDYNNNLSTINDYERSIHLWYHCKVLKDILNDDEKLWFLKKDCTASVFQILIKSLIANDPKYITYCNLNSKDTWYDTYLYIIEIFKNTLKLKTLDSDEFNLIFCRSSLKKSIMTENYEVSKNGFIKYFLKNINLNDFSLDKQEEILQIINKFFYFLRKDNDWFKYKIIEIYNFLFKKKFLIETTDESVIDINYYKTKTNSFEFKYKKTRYSKKLISLTNEKNLVKTKRSNKANYVHTLDASLNRSIINTAMSNNINIIGIHDCWMVNYTNTTKLLTIINIKMNETYHDLGLNNNNSLKYYSIFVVI